MTGPIIPDELWPAMYQVRPRSFPAGEGWREVSKRAFDDYGDFPGYPEVEWERRKLYAAQQPASAIDLGQFRALAGSWAKEAEGRESERGYIRGSGFALASCADELLALIDGTSAAGVP